VRGQTAVAQASLNASGLVGARFALQPQGNLYFENRMSNVPENLRYTKEHEWVCPATDGTALVGITDYAQQSLGDIVFVELPKPGAKFAAGATFGVVESVKAASDLFMPVAGEILEINATLEAQPELVNQDPYHAGWMLKIRPLNPETLPGLLDAAAYRKLV
jgi:glycine cleavage system H protein